MLHVRYLCDYLAGANAGDADEKVEDQGATNMLDVDQAAQVPDLCARMPARRTICARARSRLAPEVRV